MAAAAGRGRILGVALDVTARREAAERERILAREVDHRARNALALVQAALRLTRAADAAEYARLVEGRVAALARVQTLLADGGWTGADLDSLAAGELAHLAPRIAFAGPPVRLAHTAAQPIGMVLHELATNASRHGALSAATGRVSLRWRVGRGVLRFVWEEVGGPEVSVPVRSGFGDRLIEACVRTQLGGTVARHWRREGLVCEIGVPLDRAGRRDAADDGGHVIQPGGNGDGI